MDDRKLTKDTKLIFSTDELGADFFNTASRVYEIDLLCKPIYIDDEEKFGELLQSMKMVQASGLSVPENVKRIAQKLAWSEFNNAFQIGCCDTLTFEDGTTYGDNVEWLAFTQACNEFINKVKGAVIYGNGPTSDAIVRALDKKRIPFRVIKAENVYLLSENGSQQYDFLINTLQDVPSNVFEEHVVNQYRHFFDIRVSNRLTDLEDAAHKVKARNIVSGVGMLMYKLTMQYEKFTGKEVSADFVNTFFKTRGYYA